MAKKFLVILALVMASLFAFASCSSDEYAFTALENNPSADAAVYSNGGIYVEKGDYSYFINGAENGLATNTFGTEHKGALVRCLTSELTSSDRTVEVVAPKILYAGDIDSSGFYIYGDTIYYTTPNNTKDANGNVQYTMMDFMAVNLDGTGTRLIATIDSTDSPFSIVQNESGDVYIFYVGTAEAEINGETEEVTVIYEINAETGESKLIASDVDSYALDRTDGATGVAYTVTQYTSYFSTGEEEVDDYNILYYYTAGSEESVEVVNGLIDEYDKLGMHLMTVGQLIGSDIYYSSEDSYLSEDGTYKVTVSSSGDYEIIKIVAATFDSFIALPGEDAIIVQTGGYIMKYSYNSANGTTSQTRLLLNSRTITLERIVTVSDTEQYLYYSYSSTLYRINTSDENQEAVSVVTGTVTEDSVWATYDYTITTDSSGNAVVAVVYFNDSDSNTFTDYLYFDVYAYDEDEEEYTISSYRIGKLTESDTETAIEDGDDSYGVDALTDDDEEDE